MKQLVEYIVSNLVNHPEDVVIEELKSTEEEGSSSIIIQVNPEDVGRVIGRAGKVINSIRQIARIAAIQKGVRVRVDLKEDDRPEKAGETVEALTEASTKTPVEPVAEEAPKEAVKEDAPEEAVTEEVPKKATKKEAPEEVPTL